MNRILTVLILAAGCLACSGRNTGFTACVTGDAGAIGARVYCDGELIGELRQEVYGIDTSYVRKEAALAAATLSIPRGRHRLRFVSVTGDELVREVDVRDQVYLDISFGPGREGRGD